MGHRERELKAILAHKDYLDNKEYRVSEDFKEYLVLTGCLVVMALLVQKAIKAILVHRVFKA